MLLKSVSLLFQSIPWHALGFQKSFCQEINRLFANFRGIAKKTNLDNIGFLRDIFVNLRGMEDWDFKTLKPLTWHS